MARPVWKDLRAAREQRSLAALSTLSKVPLPPPPRWKLAITSALIAIAAIVADQTLTDGRSLLQKAPLHDHVWGAVASTAFFVFGCLAVRRFATQLSRLVHIGAGPTAASALRLILTSVGIVVILIATIAMVGVDPTKLLAAAGIGSVILGLAAQQSLGNVFAGIVLMVARPFSVGQTIRVRSGSFGGIFDGEVRGMGLTYVEMMTAEGFTRVPNLQLLAASIVLSPKSPPVAPPAAPTTQSPQPQLYVDRSIAKRPPRTAQPHPQRRTRSGRPKTSTATVRRPREIIRQMRERHANTDGHSGGGPTADNHGGAAEPDEPQRKDGPRRDRGGGDTE